MSRWKIIGLLLLLAPGVGAQPLLEPKPSEQPVVLTLEEAIQIALVQNRALQRARLDVENAGAQVREAWGQVLPQVNLSADYTRNLKSPNPFAGSSAGSLFNSLGFVDWLAYNERARTDDDPETEPISFGEFVDRQQQGLQEAGIRLRTGDNPFAVDNRFTAGLTIEQTLFSKTAFAAIKGAEILKEINRRGATRQEQLLIDQVRRAFYGALLAQEQVRVMAQSVERTRETLQETIRRVAQGVAPQFQRLSAEVELANLETQLIQAQNQAAQALDQFKLLLGIPIEQPVRLRGTLTVTDPGRYHQVALDDAVALALERRPDLEQLRLQVKLREVDRELAKAARYPRLSAFASFSYIGNVPDYRTIVLSDPNDPFKFSQRTNDFFSSDYWDPSVNVGLRLTWTIFSGFQTSARVQQRQIAVKQAELQYLEQLEQVRLEVLQAMRDLEAARKRLVSQERNVERAELNYEHARIRLREGVASPLEEREASQQLDQSRLNYLQAVYDYLAAQSAFEAAVGLIASPGQEDRITLTLRNESR
ncbi:outer membrane efflux protein [Rhodothermus marinus SG0.5JP17-172]|uniref:TolC family protein n=1 Tax=Rhodothermus marinus TaxID=29549 RepID=UPI000223DB0C|nr:TolC family protein [Rhodothermus marinus]AEN73904.1 outer membrane efflux protein [Rhodothermus marinus SG0.5JP17-172]